MVAGTWWLLREIELATIPAHLVEVSGGTDGLPVVSLTLPASKTDQAARGAARCHRCRCEAMGAPFSCPVHAVLDQMAFLRRQFPRRWTGGRPDQLLPLFPGLGGEAASKPAMVGTVVAAALQLDVPLANADGTTRISGHSLRVGGAQGLSRAGFPLWSIQLFGRWGGDAVKAYVGETVLDVFSRAPAPVAAEQVDLATLLATATETAPTADRRAHRPEGRRAVPRPPGIDIEEAVAKAAGELRRELQDALAQEIRLELALRAPPPRPSSRDQSVATERPWVQNDRTKAWHIEAIGPGSGQPSPHWQSICGWAFGRSGGFSVETPAVGDEKCKRCMDISAQRRARCEGEGLVERCV